MQRAVGLDIGWGRISVIELVEGKRIEKFATSRIKRPQEPHSQHRIAQQIDDIFRAHNISRDRVITNLRGSHILARTYHAPVRNQDAFEHWFVENIDALIPGTPLDDVIYDYLFLDNDRVLISFARLGVVMEKINMFRDAGITPRAIDASCLGLYHAFRCHPWLRKKKTCAFLDVGCEMTDLLILNHGIPFASAELPCVFRQNGNGEKAREDFIMCLSSRILKTLDFYRKKESMELQGVIITGEKARMRGMRTALERTLNMKVKIGNPFSERKIAFPPDFSTRKSLAYTQAVGLALRGLSDEKHINLIPPEVKKRHTDEQFKKRARKTFIKNVIAAAVIGAVSLFLLIVVAGKYRTSIKTVEELVKQKQTLVHVSSEERELREKVAQLHTLGRQQYTWSKMLYNIGQVVPSGVSFREISTRSRLVKNADQMIKVQHIVLEGDAQNHSKIVQFIENLEGYFDTIIVDQIKEDEGCEFSIVLKH